MGRLLFIRLHIPPGIVEVVGWMVLVLGNQVQSSVAVAPENFVTANHQTVIRRLALGKSRKVVIMQLGDVEGEQAVGREALAAHGADVTVAAESVLFILKRWT
jgi:hypothetical protein